MAKNSIEELAVNWVRAKREAELAATVASEAAEKLIAAMDAAGADTGTVPDAQGGALRFTVVRGTTVSIDWDAVEKDVPKNVWKKVTKTVVDPSLVEAAVAMGAIKAETVAKHSEVKPRKAFVKPSGTYDIDTLGLTKQGPRRKAALKVQP